MAEIWFRKSGSNWKPFEILAFIFSISDGNNNIRLMNDDVRIDEINKNRWFVFFSHFRFSHLYLSMQHLKRHRMIRCETRRIKNLRKSIDLHKSMAFSLISEMSIIFYLKTFIVKICTNLANKKPTTSQWRRKNPNWIKYALKRKRTHQIWSNEEWKKPSNVQTKRIDWSEMRRVKNNERKVEKRRKKKIANNCMRYAL